MKKWKPPPTDYLPDFRSLEGLLSYGEDMELIIPVPLIVGSFVNAYEWNPDWTLRMEELRKEPHLLNYHKRKFKYLLYGSDNGKLPPITEESLLRGGFHYDLHLCRLEGIFAVASGGLHRVAVAHQKRFKRLRAVVTPCWFKSNAPRAAKKWVISLCR